MLLDITGFLLVWHWYKWQLQDLGGPKRVSPFSYKTFKNLLVFFKYKAKTKLLYRYGNILITQKKSSNKGYHIDGVIGSVVDRALVPRSYQTENYEISICCFSAKHAALSVIIAS